jgi:hypothetical protein
MDKNRITQSVCCYGCFNTKERTLALFQKAESILSNYGFQFDILYAIKKTSLKSKKNTYSYKKIEKLTEDDGYFNHKGCISAPKKWNTGWEIDYTIFLSVSRNHSIITFAEEGFTLNETDMRKIILEFSEILKSPYSIGFSMPYNKSPFFYTCGIGYENNPIYKLGSPEQEAQDRFSRWGRVGMPEKVYLRGVIREVYPINLLCRPQVFFPFRGKPFLECVRSGVIGGTIEEITSERFLWIVPESDIPIVTEKCEKAGFLFNQLKDVPGDVLWDDPSLYHTSIFCFVVDFLQCLFVLLFCGILP